MTRDARPGERARTPARGRLAAAALCEGPQRGLRVLYRRGRAPGRAPFVGRRAGAGGAGKRVGRGTEMARAHGASPASAASASGSAVRQAVPAAASPEGQSQAKGRARTKSAGQAWGFPPWQPTSHQNAAPRRAARPAPPTALSLASNTPCRGGSPFRHCAREGTALVCAAGRGLFEKAVSSGEGREGLLKLGLLGAAVVVAATGGGGFVLVCVLVLVRFWLGLGVGCLVFGRGGPRAACRCITSSAIPPS
jgi:hypothetical protein